MMSGSHLSKDFFDLVKSIGESRSKQEEDKIVLHEVHVLKEKMATKNLPPKKMKEYLIRMIYVEMLGHDASFGHIHAIKMVSEKKLLEKRVGYLAVCLVLHPQHEFMLLLVNSLQIDLKSDNFLEVSMALTTVCRMASVETVPALLPLVVNILEHKQSNVRKKAALALTRFHQLDPTCIAPIMDKARKILCDKDPCVMGASLCLFQSLAMQSAAQLKDLVPSFVGILKQVTEHRLPRDYDYHRMPGPWIQLHLLQLLAILGAADKQASEGMYEILTEVMKRADIGINVGYAIVYECVKTVTTIYPDPNLIETAALAISRFITSENHNLKYLGVNSLAAIVQLDSKYAAEHQLLVIDCLEDPDETLRRKTLDLLYSMTNANNVVVIVQKLVAYLDATTDVYLRTDLVGRINQLSEKFSPTTWWYVETCANIFEKAGELVKPEVAHNLMKIISESDEMVVDQSGQEIELKKYTVNVFLGLLQKPNLPDILVQVIVWTLGEFGHLSSRANEIAQNLIQALDKHYDSSDTRCWILGALTKLSVQMPAIIPTVRESAAKYQDSLSVDLQQRVHEYLELTKNPGEMSKVLPQDSEIKVDKDLGFLANFVNNALQKGARQYDPNTKEVSASASAPHKKELRFEAYAKVETAQVSTTNVEWNEQGHSNNWNEHHAAPAANTFPTSLTTAGKRGPWGPAAEEAPAPAAAVPKVETRPSFVAPPVEEPKKYAPKKEEPKVLTEKEKMAAALFGGTPAVVPKPKTAGTTVAPARSTFTAPTAAPAAKPAAAAAAAPVASTPIIDLGLGNVSAPKLAPAPAKPSNDLDFLGEFFGPSTVSSAPPVVPVVTPSVPVQPNIMPATIAPTPVVSAPAPKPSLFDPFEALTATPAPDTSSPLDILSSFGAPAAVAPSCPVGLAGMSAGMKGRLASFRQSAEQALGSNQSLHVASIKVFLPDRTLVVLCITNKTSQSFPSMSVQFSSPPGLVLAYDGEPVPRVEGNTVVLSPAPALSTCTLIVSVQCRDPSYTGAPLNGQVGAGSQPLAFSQPLSAADFQR